MNFGQAAGLCALFFSAPLMAGETRVWSQDAFEDFEKGVVRNLSLRSDGRLTLAPLSRELYNSPSAYLWALAQDSKGNLYAGGGTGAKLFQIEPDGDRKIMAELEGLEIHAIAVDAKDRVFAATSPDGKVYRVPPSGKPEVFYDPEVKYIWAMAFDPRGDLFVATGDRGEIHRVTPDGKGSVFFSSDETHVRSLAIDGAGNLIAGTDPSGLVLRVSPAGDGFVLYQMSKKEVTAVVVAPDGTVYAAAVGNKQAPRPAVSPAPAPVAPVQITVNAAAPNAPAVPRPPASQPAPAAAPPQVTGGSEVYRIEPSGYPRRLWSNSQDIVYAMTLDRQGHLLLGTGNKGNIYRIESPTVYTALRTLPATQVTAFQTGRDGRVHAATGNVGRIYEIGPGFERSGTIESDVFDSGLYSTWGRLTFEANLNGGEVAVSTRSGNLDQPQKNWSPWSAAVTSAKGARITSPPSRFVQWKATLTSNSSDRSPEVDWIDVAYLPKNIEPHISDIEITPFNYRFPAPVAASSATPSLTLPPLGRRPAASSASSTGDTTVTPAMPYAKGSIGARWTASDTNGDTLIYTVQIRGTAESEWKPLKEKVREKYVSWDSTAFPDGEYRLLVTASDAPSNPPSDALTVQAESEPFLIDNTPPRITGLTASRNGTRLEARWHAADAHSILDRAEYSLNGGEWTVVAPVTRLTDAQDLDYSLTIENTGPGEHTIAVRVQDEYENQSTEKAVVRAGS
jgi:hypothetical protein